MRGNAFDYTPYNECVDVCGGDEIGGESGGSYRRATDMHRLYQHKIYRRLGGIGTENYVKLL